MFNIGMWSAALGQFIMQNMAGQIFTSPDGVNWSLNGMTIKKEDVTKKFWGAMNGAYGPYLGTLAAAAAREFIAKELMMPNLFPDMQRKSYVGSEDFIFAAPIAEDAWLRIDEHADKCMNTAKTPWFRLPRGLHHSHVANLDVTILLRRPFETDDDMLEAAAWLRVVKSNRDRIYAVPWYKGEIDLIVAMQKTIGAPRHLSVMFDVPQPTKEKDNG